MTVRKAFLSAIILLLISHADFGFAQGPGQIDDGLPVSSQLAAKNAPEGIEKDGFRIQQSVEFGYRVTDVTGSVPMYNTLVNLQTGPRILEQSLEMQSMTHDDFPATAPGCGPSSTTCTTSARASVGIRTTLTTICLRIR